MSQIWDRDPVETTEISLANIPARSLKVDHEAIDRFRQQFGALIEEIDLWALQPNILYQADPYPIPAKWKRELYFGDDHIAYWLSGLLDAEKIIQRLKLERNQAYEIIDLGCASGRLLRHLLIRLAQSKFWGLDLKRSNIEWLRDHLHSPRVKSLHNSALPTISLESNRFDVISALSVFTHIDFHEEEWLLELRRLLKPGGRLYLTVITDRAWNRIGTDDLLKTAYINSHEYSLIDFGRPMPVDRFVFHGLGTGPAYMETVLHKVAYIEKNWFPFFSSGQWFAQGHDFQDVLVLEK